MGSGWTRVEWNIVLEDWEHGFSGWTQVEWNIVLEDWEHGFSG